MCHTNGNLWQICIKTKTHTKKLENMKKERITIRFSEAEIQDIEKLRSDKKKTASQIIREAVRSYIEYGSNQTNS